MIFKHISFLLPNKINYYKRCNQHKKILDDRAFQKQSLGFI
ncbi:hypothetical protein GYO_2280 [Bacillus spizizenii TU-B-10]|uniref:Uncharacterized protein n=1 Tax=Bacillus spizizenii (strain DSM 15029 / JCM 12233 / NBRC 101239 / NRRL B-23049 / TU-B-10) TaxID=1052585 RepID=G4NPX8_BACS4|nr:hypothetical protein GYO_2280 [Bacillus spizizenii TU-B-10]